MIPKLKWSRKPMRPKLLIVEDDKNDAFFLQTHLKKCGFESDWEKTAEAGFALLKSFKHPVVFVDIGLPHEDGISLAKRIHAEKGLEKVVVVILTGSLPDMELYPPGLGVFLIRKNGVDETEMAVRDVLENVRLL